MGVSINDDVTSFFQRAARNAPQAERAAVRRGTEMVYEEAFKGAQGIEKRPISRSKTGRPRWRRTGKLKKSIVKKYPDARTGVVTVEGDAEKYAARRHQLGATSGEGAWTPKNPADGIIRRNEFFKDAADTLEDRLPDAVVSEFINHLEP